MDTSSTAAAAARTDWYELANRYEDALRKTKALSRNAEYTLSDNTGGVGGSPGDFAIPKGVYEEIVAMLSGIEAITDRALEVQ